MLRHRDDIRLASKVYFFLVFYNFLSIHLFQNAVSHAVSHPDVFWYHLNGMGAQKNAPKKVLATLFPDIFHVKTK